LHQHGFAAFLKLFIRSSEVDHPSRGESLATWKACSKRCEFRGARHAR
jgi:hypothetical protein